MRLLPREMRRSEPCDRSRSVPATAMSFGCMEVLPSQPYPGVPPGGYASYVGIAMLCGPYPPYPLYIKLGRKRLGRRAGATRYGPRAFTGARGCGGYGGYGPAHAARPSIGVAHSRFQIARWPRPSLFSNCAAVRIAIVVASAIVSIQSNHRLDSDTIYPIVFNCL